MQFWALLRQFGTLLDQFVALLEQFGAIGLVWSGRVRSVLKGSEQFWTIKPKNVGIGLTTRSPYGDKNSNRKQKQKRSHLAWNVKMRALWRYFGVCLPQLWAHLFYFWKHTARWKSKRITVKKSQKYFSAYMPTIFYLRLQQRTVLFRFRLPKSDFDAEYN